MKLNPTAGGEGYESPRSNPIDVSEVDGGAGLGVDPGMPITTIVAVAAAATDAADDGGESEEQVADLEHLTNAELQSMLSARGLPTYGTKAELVERLRSA